MDDPYRKLAEAFDQAAPDYDELYATRRVMSWLRQESLSILQATFPPGSRLLEVGCGTGEEALALSALGYQVVATDLSPAMIACAQAKARSSRTGAVTWRVIAAGQVGDLARDYGPAWFDGAYSSFGALNCEPALDRVAAALALLLRSGASLVCSVMNRWCGWEIGWGMLHFRPLYALRRLRRGWSEAGLTSREGSTTVPVRYYTPGGFARAFAPHFAVQRVLGFPTFLPPPGLEPVTRLHPSLLAQLEAAERRWRRRPAFAAFGDHFLIALERTDGEADRPTMPVSRQVR